MTTVSPASIRVRRLGRKPYRDTLARMQSFTTHRDASTPDEIWLLEHPAVFTLGQAGRREHVLAAGDIEVVQSDRGGQVTFHGPGQLVVYTLLDLTRRGLGVRETVCLLEESVIVTLAQFGVVADRRDGAPGVYVAGEKIAALGLRVRHGRCYHGLSLNVDMDLEPFSRINPCGYPGLAVTRVVDHAEVSATRVADTVLARMLDLLGAGEEPSPAEWPPAARLAAAE